MGVYIKGMEMPDRDHLVLVDIDSNGDVFAAYDGGRTKLTQHKAVSVPEPHGRLIDADALEYEEAYLNGHYELGDVEIVTRKDIESAPTIIQAEEG